VVRQQQQGLHALERAVEGPPLLRMELEAQVSSRDVVSEDDRQAPRKLACQPQLSSAGQTGAILQDPLAQLLTAALPAMGDVERLRDIGRGAEGREATVVGLALRLARARAVDFLHWIEEGAHLGAGAVQRLDDGMLFGAGVLVLIADHHWISARQHVGDERPTLQEACHPTAVAVVIGQASSDQPRFRIGLGDLANQAIDRPDFQAA